MFPPPKFFPEISINLAEILLRQSVVRQDSVAIHFVREGVDGVENVTWGQLRLRTERVCDAMAGAGVRQGDRVAAAISNSVDAIVICLAALSIGAIFSSAAPELGSKAIFDRFVQIKPKLIFADNAYCYGGKLNDVVVRISEWASQLISVENNIVNVVVLHYCSTPVDLDTISKGISWKDFIAMASGRPLTFKMLPFTHPAFLLYSSGTVSPGPPVYISNLMPKLSRVDLQSVYYIARVSVE
jgi:acetoacetyl-CoA synthetase